MSTGSKKYKEATELPKVDEHGFSGTLRIVTYDNIERFGYYDANDEAFYVAKGIYEERPVTPLKWAYK